LHALHKNGLEKSVELINEHCFRTARRLSLSVVEHGRKPTSARPHLIALLAWLSLGWGLSFALDRDAFFYFMSVVFAIALTLKNESRLPTRMPRWLLVSLWIPAGMFLLLLGFIAVRDWLGFEGLTSRLTDAKHASATHQGAIYDASIGALVGPAMEACIPPDLSKASDVGAFVLVGYVTSSGALVEVEVQPRTELSSCFAESFSKSVLPRPPISVHPRGYPIAVEIGVSP
jgi:hypothetical protein